ncbi:Ribosomal protein S28e [Macrophomina phaseolina MS6]|uniref:Ribosomal protein S28e n=1 Tax=Macrophomina phaseolina (strain MS6) TaxID=1126212 RepID=K2R5G9_MACPH|nr:Ribosomal protein S28e [Macrophomina phaseolina MS6]
MNEISGWWREGNVGRKENSPSVATHDSERMPPQRNFLSSRLFLARWYPKCPVNISYEKPSVSSMPERNCNDLSASTTIVPNPTESPLSCKSYTLILESPCRTSAKIDLT